MKEILLGLICLIILNLTATIQAREPSLEELEDLGAELDIKQNTPAAMPNAEQKKSPPPNESLPSAVSVPATDTNESAPIDIRSRIKKVMEPNLFAGAPPLPGTLRNMAIGEAPEEYAVHEGDNLSDICDQLLDEPGYWPKLWALNPDIANPHFIYPGMKLHFYAGNADNPPYLQVVTEDDIVPVDKAGMVEKELVREDIGGMLMRSEIPSNQTVMDGKDLEQVPGIDDMFEVIGQRDAPEKVQLVIPAFIVSEYIENLGEVIGGSTGSFLIDSGQDIIIDPEDELKLGSTLTIVRKTGKIRTSHGNDFVGIRYEFIAQIRIDSKDEKADSYRAKVVYNRLGVQPGDYVVSYRSIKRFLPTKVPALTQAKGQQIVGFAEPFMELDAQGFVFLDQTQEKLQEGGVYAIMQNVKRTSMSFLISQLPDTETRVSRAYILDTAGSAALGYILTDNLEVRLGDHLSP